MDLMRFGWSGANIVDVASGLNVTQINGSAAAASNLAISANALVVGVSVAGTLTTSKMTTGLTATVANIYAGRVLIFTTGVNQGLVVLITAYQVAGGTITFSAYGSAPAPAAPSVGDQFVIL